MIFKAGALSKQTTEQQPLSRALLAPCGAAQLLDFAPSRFWLEQSSWWVAADAEDLNSQDKHSKLVTEFHGPRHNIKNKPLLHPWLMALLKTFEMPHLRR